MVLVPKVLPRASWLLQARVDSVAAGTAASDFHEGGPMGAGRSPPWGFPFFRDNCTRSRLLLSMSDLRVQLPGSQGRMLQLGLTLHGQFALLPLDLQVS